MNTFQGALIVRPILLNTTFQPLPSRQKKTKFAYLCKMHTYPVALTVRTNSDNKGKAVQKIGMFIMELEDRNLSSFPLSRLHEPLLP